MLSAELIGKIMNEAIENFYKSLTKTQAKLKVAQALEAEGIEVVKYGYMPWDFEVKRENLPLVRKIVGRIKVTGKCLADNYDKTGEIIVSITPVTKELEGVFFSYRTKLRGNKCKVEEITAQPYTYKTLVCSS